jgi:hypothetical protein
MESETDRETLNLLVSLGRSDASGVYLRPPADEDAIAGMQAAAARELGQVVPDSYLALLRVSNGVQINGAYFKEVQNLVAENLDTPRNGVIVLGNDGNTAEYVFDKRDRRYCTVTMGTQDERLASFAKFGEMLSAVMKEQQVLNAS